VILAGAVFGGGLLSFLMHAWHRKYCLGPAELVVMRDAVNADGSRPYPPRCTGTTAATGTIQSSSAAADRMVVAPVPIVEDATQATVSYGAVSERSSRRTSTRCSTSEVGQRFSCHDLGAELSEIHVNRDAPGTGNIQVGRYF